MRQSNRTMRSLGDAYRALYGVLAGTHPNTRPWHFQWLFLRETHRWQRARMADLKGRLLDVGCGTKPYASWVTRGPQGVTEYVGLDVEPGSEVDIAVGPRDAWPIAAQSVDAALFLQVLEHVEAPEHTLSELARVLRPGGTLLATVPFIYPAHGLPHDYVRLTVAGIERLFSPQFEIVELVPLGRAGATIGNLFLTWIENNLSANAVTRVCKGLLLPFWLPFALLVNAMCVLIDRLDRSGTHYANVGLLARRRRVAP